jgi:hypothetical protein
MALPQVLQMAFICSWARRFEIASPLYQYRVFFLVKAKDSFITF